jgi:hypothetical protein
MPREYDNNNSFVLYVNDRKEKDGQPDRTGSATIDGVEYWLSAWINRTDKVTGGQCLSGKATPKDDDRSSRGNSRRNGNSHSYGSRNRRDDRDDRDDKDDRDDRF